MSTQKNNFSFMQVKIKSSELTPRRVLRDKRRASAGPKGQFLSALKDEFFGHLDNKLNIIVDRLILMKLSKKSIGNVSTHEFVIVLRRIALRKSQTHHINPFDCPHFVVSDNFCQFPKIIVQVS